MRARQILARCSTDKEEANRHSRIALALLHSLSANLGEEYRKSFRTQRRPQIGYAQTNLIDPKLIVCLLSMRLRLFLATQWHPIPLGFHWCWGKRHCF